MQLARGQRGWLVVVVLLTAAATATYAWTTTRPLRPVSGGSGPGLLFGGAGTACMLVGAALTVRKRLVTWRVGKVSRWLEAHVWFALLALPLILCHSGFRFGGPLTTALMLLFLVSWLSGVVGLLLQQFVPRLMTEQVPRETIYEQIDHVVLQLRDEARALVEKAAGSFAPPVKDPPPGSAALRDFYVAIAEPWLAARRPRPALFDRPEVARVHLDQLQRLLPPELHTAASELFEICEERRQIERQRRLHHWLHGWLLVHVPVSWALLAATAFHAIRALRF